VLRAYYYNVPTKYRALKCPIANAARQRLDEWDQQRKGLPASGISMPKYGMVDWLFREYKLGKAYLEKAVFRSRNDYEWSMLEACDTLTKRGDRVGDRLKNRQHARSRHALRSLYCRR
jgi:hypothetical protein